MLYLYIDNTIFTYIMKSNKNEIMVAYIPIKSILKKYDSVSKDDDEDDDEDDDDEDYEDDEDDEDDEDYEEKRSAKKVKISKNNRLVLKIQNPTPIRTLGELITVLEKSTKTIKIKHKSNEGEKKETVHKSLYSKSEKKQVSELVENLKQLRDMVGMENVKQNIVNQLLLFMQELNDPGMFLHTVLTGGPGSGKTTLCHILSKIYKSMGFLEKSEITIADRPKLIGQWLGETAIKTKKVLDSARGGILLIDEAYSLGDQEGGRDSFSKECIDTLNQYLSEHVDDFVCIVAGYKEDLDKCFFAVNQGLARRFPWRYDMDKYTPDNMVKIMNIQLKKQNWSVDVTDEYMVGVVKGNKDLFNNYGGDTNNFLEKCKVCHAQRIFGDPKAVRKVLTLEDIGNGMKLFKETKSKHNEKNPPPFGMYF